MKISLLTDAQKHIVTGLTKSMEKQIAIIDQIALHMDGVIKQLYRQSPAKVGQPKGEINKALAGE